MIDVKKSMKAIVIAMLLSIVTACGGGGSSSASEAVIETAQEALDVITTVLDSSTALIGTKIDELQAEFDGFVNSLINDGTVTAAAIQAVQDALDAYTGTTDGSAGALSAADIQLAQDALDGAHPSD